MFTPLMPGDKAHIYSHLVFSANGSAVDTTIVDGQILMRGRELLTMDEPQILAEANAGVPAHAGEDPFLMQIDAHTHILSLAEDAEFTTEYGREGSLCIYRSLGLLPSHRPPTEEEWEASGYSRQGLPGHRAGRVGPRPSRLRQDRDPGRVARSSWTAS